METLRPSEMQQITSSWALQTFKDFKKKKKKKSPNLFK